MKRNFIALCLLGTSILVQAGENKDINKAVKYRSSMGCMACHQGGESIHAESHAKKLNREKN